MRGAGLLNPHSTNIQEAAPTQMLGHSGKPGEHSLKQWCALPWRQRGNRDGSPPHTERQKLLLTLCSVQRKNALSFLNLLGSCTVPACPGGNLQETTEAPTMKSYQSPTHRKLKHIIKTKESKSPADRDNPLNPRAAHATLCLYVSKPLVVFRLPWNSCKFEIGDGGENQ